MLHVSSENFSKVYLYFLTVGLYWNTYTKDFKRNTSLIYNNKSYKWRVNL